MRLKAVFDVLKFLSFGLKLVSIGLRDTAPTLGFRFVLVYCLLFTVPMLAGWLPGLMVTPAQTKAFLERRRAQVRDTGVADVKDAPNPIVASSQRVLEEYGEWRKAVLREAGEEHFDLDTKSMPFQPTGSGDTMSNYLEVLLKALVAFAVAVGWSLLGRPSARHPRAARFLHFLIRWFLFMVLVPWYGFAKVIPSQFQEPGFQLLLKTWEDSSPMGIVWRFMGLSMPYTIFSGAMEILGGVLLCFRRTTTLGALVTVAVMTNVALLNFCYDVPVKLYSAHYLLMALGLAAADGRRLLAFFVRNHPVPPAAIPPLFSSRVADRAATVFKLLFVGWVVYLEIAGGLDNLAQRKEAVAPPPFHGIHDVESFVQEGVEVPPLRTDNTRWRTLVVERKDRALVQMTNDVFHSYTFKPDLAAETVEISTFGATPSKFSLAFRQPEAGVILFEGEIEGKRTVIKARSRDLTKSTLRSHPFRWVCELPFNR